MIILCLLTSILIVWQFILPRYNQLASLGNEVGSLEQKISKLEKLDAQLNDLMMVYKQNEEMINKFYKILPAGKDIPGILDRFELLSFQSGMILSSIDFSEGAKQTSVATVSSEEAPASAAPATAGIIEKSPLKTLTLNIKLSGTYDSFRVFLSNLENLVRLSDVQTISFSFSAENTDLADFGVATNVYYK